MTAFVCSDIHSFYDEWMGALNTQGFNIKNDNHILVVLGDLLDRGPKSQECLDFVNNLPENRKILIKGNHEDLIERVIARGGFYMHDFHNGTVKTISDLTGVEYGECVYNPLQVINELSKNESLYKYLNSCVDYFENKNLIFTHGWIPCTEGCFYSYDENWRNGNWEKARWVNGFEAWHAGIIEPNKTIWCGHWHTSWAHSKLHKDGSEWDDDFYEHGIKDRNPLAIFTPFEDVGIVGMDACTAYSGFVNCKKISRFKL